MVLHTIICVAFVFFNTHMRCVQKVVIKQGDSGHSMYTVVDGYFDVIKETEGSGPRCVKP
jgi:CRP-like cAMP-binding protein